MIAAQVHALEVGQRALAQPIDDTAGVRSAVHIVADKHHSRAGGRQKALLLLDRRDQHLEQVEPAMDIADGVDPLALGRAGRRRVPLGAPDRGLPLPQEEAHGCCAPIVVTATAGSIPAPDSNARRRVKGRREVLQHRRRLESAERRVCAPQHVEVLEDGSHHIVDEIVSDVGAGHEQHRLGVQAEGAPQARHRLALPRA